MNNQDMIKVFLDGRLVAVTLGEDYARELLQLIAKRCGLTLHRVDRGVTVVEGPFIHGISIACVYHEDLMTYGIRGMRGGRAEDGPTDN